VVLRWWSAAVPGVTDQVGWSVALHRRGGHNLLSS
jgi:hypothetical protein